MSNTVQCARCGQTHTKLVQPPLPGSLGVEVQERACSDCWQLWTEEEVRVINELRLNFMDPNSETILHQRLREFLQLPPESEPVADENEG